MIWLVLACMLIVFALYLSSGDLFDGAEEGAKAWFAAWLFPVVGLVSGTFFPARRDPDRPVSRTKLQIASGLSVLYFCVIVATVAHYPFAEGAPPFSEYLAKTAWPLSSMHAIVVASLVSVLSD